jgi:hypothetical protein
MFCFGDYTAEDVSVEPQTMEGADDGSHHDGESINLSFVHALRQTRNVQWNDSPQECEPVRRAWHDDGQSTLFILRLVSLNQIMTFPLDPTSSWNLRGSLGWGSSFLVEEAQVSRSREIYIPYRNTNLLGQDGLFHFTDHTGLKWTYETPFAFKLPNFGPARDNGVSAVIRSLATELRILCHPPIQAHPNIVRLVGVAWVNDEDIDFYTATDRETERAWPIAVIEKADEGSVTALLSTRRYRNVQPTLLAKFKICIDVLRAISVRITGIIGTISPGQVVG